MSPPACLFLVLLLALLAPSLPLSTPPPPSRPQTIQSSLDSLYASSQSIRCPFFRRRAQDVVDSSAIVLRFLVARHKTLFPAWAMEMTLTPPGSLPLLDVSDALKSTNLDAAEMLSIVEGGEARLRSEAARSEAKGLREGAFTGLRCLDADYFRT